MTTRLSISWDAALSLGFAAGPVAAFVSVDREALVLAIRRKSERYPEAWSIHHPNDLAELADWFGLSEAATLDLMGE